MTHKLLFLDFDGVMHSTNDQSVFFEKADLLKKALIDTPVEIIISSSWRFQFNLNQLKKFFPREIQDKVVGVTGDPVIGKFPRYNEILNYLKFINQTLCDWRALDDFHLEFPKECENLILCSSNTGLQQKQITALKKWLKN